MAKRIRLGDIAVDVVFKDIKNVHLSVHPPSGKARLSAPSRMKLETLRLFCISKVGWIRQQQRRMREQERETPREFLERESHYVWGKRHLLRVIERDGLAGIQLQQGAIVLRIRPGAGLEKRRRILEEWYRGLIKSALPELLTRWEPRIGVSGTRVFVQRMKTKWGGCSPERKNIRLNTDLARKPRECLEYIVVHELVHLLEPSHDDRFVALMDRHLPHWRALRDLLNRLPVRHEEWRY